MMGSPSILGTAPVGVTSHRPNHVGQMLMTAPVPGVAPVDAPPAQRLERLVASRMCVFDCRAIGWLTAALLCRGS